MTPSDPLARLLDAAKAALSWLKPGSISPERELMIQELKDAIREARDTAQPGAGCNCKSANNPDGTSEPVLFTAETGKVYGVDACIAPVIAELHRLGMPTRASCCGHGIQPPSVIMETDMDHYDCLRLLKRIDHRLWSVERVRP